MGNTLNIAGNRLGNTVAIAPRTAGTIVTTAADLFITLKTMGKEAAEIMADTSQNVKKVLINTWTEKNNIFKKSIKIAVSPVVAGISAAEGAGRAFFQPIINGISNTRNTGKNTVKNGRRSTFGRLLSKKPISDFSFENLNTRKLNLKNSTSSWWLNGNTSSNSAKDVEASSKSKKSTRFGNLWKKNKKEKSSSTKDNDKNTESIQDKENENSKENNTEKKDLTIKIKDENNIENPNEDENVKKTKDILTNSQHGGGLYNKFREKYTGLEIMYNRNGTTGGIKTVNNKHIITIGEKMPKNKLEIAPLNESKDVEYQKKHVLAHEFGHLMIDDNTGNKHIDSILNISKKYQKNGETLAPLAQMKIYKSNDQKAKEDISEMLAIYTLSANGLNKYLSKLTSDKKEDEKYRKEFNLAKITEVEKDSIKLICKTILSKYTDNKNKGQIDSRVDDIKGKAIEMTKNIDKSQYKKAA